MGKDRISDEIAKFYEAVLSLETMEECSNFFDDVCTVNELRAISQRFEVAGMLKEGHTYLDIADKTGASTATIGRVNRTLTGGKGGYDLILKRVTK